MRLYVLAVCVVLPSLAFAQGSADPMVANRPGGLDAAVVVPGGFSHLESGGSLLESRSAGSATQITGAPALLRFGLGDGWELRFSEGITRIASGGAVTSGLVDPALAIVRQLTVGTGFAPNAMIIVESTVPTGVAGLSGRGMQPNVRFAEGWALPGGRSLNLVQGAAWVESATGHTPIGLAGIAVSQPLTGRLTSFVEMSSPRLSFNGAGSVVFARTGLAFLVHPSLQLDMDLAKGLTATERGVNLNFGFAIRR